MEKAKRFFKKSDGNGGLVWDVFKIIIIPALVGMYMIGTISAKANRVIALEHKVDHHIENVGKEMSEMRKEMSEKLDTIYLTIIEKSKE